MGLEELLAALEGDARDEIARVDAEARREASAIVACAEEEAHGLEELLVAEAEKEATAESELRLRRARLEAERVLRDAREAAFRDLLEGVRRRLAAIRGDETYTTLLPALVRESLVALPGARTLRVDARDEAAAAASLRALGREDVAVEASLSTWGGVEAASNDGRKVVDTLEERLVNGERLLRLRLAGLAREAGG